MPALPEPIASLIGALSKLPGIGPRSAERIALHLVQAESGAVKQLAETILNARERVRFCEALRRAHGAVALRDLRRPAPGCLAGLHRRAAGGHSQPREVRHLSRPIPRAGRQDLAPERRRAGRPAHRELEQRLARGPIKEIVMALGTDVEGDATSYYLAKRLAREGLKITRHRSRPARRHRAGVCRRTHLEPGSGRTNGAAVRAGLN